MSEPRPTAPDYTDSALAMLGVNLFWILCAIWTILGFTAVLLVALVLNHIIDRYAALHDAVPQVED